MSEQTNTNSDAKADALAAVVLVATVVTMVLYWVSSH